ncbi:MAG: phosphate ABC transporter permease PstA [Pseudomonadota bacterium]
MTIELTELSAQHTSDAAARRARSRHWAEFRLKAYGIIAISLAAAALVILASTIVVRTVGTVYEYYISIDVELDLRERDLARINDPDPRIRADLRSVIRDGLRGTVEGDLGRAERRQLFALTSGDAGFELGDLVKADRQLLGETLRFRALLDDEVQLYLKGKIGELHDAGSFGTVTPRKIEGSDEIELGLSPLALAEGRAMLQEARAAAAKLERAEASRQAAAVAQTEADIAEATDASQEEKKRLEDLLSRFTTARDAANARADALLRKATDRSAYFRLTSGDPSIILRLNGGWLKVTALSQERLAGIELDPLDSLDPPDEGDWQALLFDRPESERNISDRQLVWLENLERSGTLDRAFNWRILSQSDSSNAELAGIWGALVGSFWTMMVTFLIAFPVGVLAAIYLEEFAPKNRVTDLIEVNINNLAAVPSIVFGLLGLLLFVSGLKFNVFGMEIMIGGFVPRSSPMAGGMVLALMTLPTIIIAARASIRAVPPSIRDAALAIGASKLQTATHHVLPLAMPGIMTGTIIGMAQALGETAPLLMVGMNSFIQEPPASPLEPGNVLPTLIYQWNNHSERLFDDKTAAAISILLIFLVAMNALAVLLRKRFERRW